MDRIGANAQKHEALDGGSKEWLPINFVAWLLFFSFPKHANHILEKQYENAPITLTLETAADVCSKRRTQCARQVFTYRIRGTANNCTAHYANASGVAKAKVRATTLHKRFQCVNADGRSLLPDDKENTHEASAHTNS